MWTTLPPSGFGLQPPSGLGNAPIGPATLALPNFAGFAGTMPAATQPMPGPTAIPTSAYGYAPGLIAVSPQSLGASSLARSPSGDRVTSAIARRRSRE